MSFRGAKGDNRASTHFCRPFVLSGRPPRKKSSKPMAFPHPKSRKHKHGNEDKPSSGSVVWNLFKRTINITEYGNAKDDVNPANNRTLGGLTNHLVPFH